MSSLAITAASCLRLIPREELQDFQSEVSAAQAQALRWLAIIQEIKSAPHGQKTDTIAAICRRTGKSRTTINRHVTGYNRHGWQSLINRAKFPRPNTCGLPSQFKLWVPALFSRFQRNNAAKQVHRYLIDRLAKWRSTLSAEFAIPGYVFPPDDGAHGHPDGWSYKNISRLKPSTFNLITSRQGPKTASAHLPNNYTTRCGLKFGERIFFDDQEHDLKVNLLGRNSRAMRPKGFNALDHLSGAFVDYTSKMTLWDPEEGKSRTLKQKDFTWFNIHTLLHVGYRTDATGTTFIFEHGTGTGYKGFDDILHHVTSGHVTVWRGGKFNDPMFSGMLFRPQSAGNFRTKSPLESLFNLDRNYMAALPSPTGSNQRLNGPEEHHGLDKYNNQLLKLWHQLPESQRSLIRFPMLAWPEFAALQAQTYQLINGRTDHKLEGWEKCGFIAPRFRLDPSQPWQDRAVLETIDPERAKAIGELADWRVFPLSPSEVVAQHKHELTRLDPSLVPLLLPDEWLTDVKVNKDHEIHINDIEVSSEPFIYIASLTNQAGRHTIESGKELKAYWHPICADKLWLCNPDGSFIGTLDQYIKPTAGDTPTILTNQGRINAVKSDLNQWTKRNLGAVRTERLDMKEHNRRLAAGEEMDPNVRRQNTQQQNSASRLGHAARNESSDQATNHRSRHTDHSRDTVAEDWSTPDLSPEAPAQEQPQQIEEW